MGRYFLRAAQVISTLLFIFHMRNINSANVLSWLLPLALIGLIVINSIRFTRFVAWVIFAFSFFAFLVVLSAFTLRWRLEPGFSSAPFYISMCMYIAFIYVSLAQIKILGSPIPDNKEQKNEN